MEHRNHNVQTNEYGHAPILPKEVLQKAHNQHNEKTKSRNPQTTPPYQQKSRLLPNDDKNQPKQQIQCRRSTIPFLTSTKSRRRVQPINKRKTEKFNKHKAKSQKIKKFNQRIAVDDLS